ncbi:hypothetical protein BJ546DRAFT_975170 [Cryomyces antarcticus]
MTRTMAPLVPRTPLAILLLLVSSTTAQLLVYGSGALPTCAQSCSLLQQAQAACVPPATPASNQATYQNCFCQSAYLRTFYTTPNGVCDAFCGQADLVQIQTWYTTLCASPVTVTATTTTAGPSSTTVVGENPTTAGPSTTGSSGVGSTISSGSGVQSGSWWSNHYKWVIMLIVLFIAFLALAMLGIFLKRRHARRRDMPTSTFNATVTEKSVPESNGEMYPREMTSTPVPYTQGYGDRGAASGKGKAKEGSATNVADPGGQDLESGPRKLRK